VSVVDKDVQQSIWGVLDSGFTHRPYIGDDIGFVHQIDQELRTNNGSPYSLAVSTYATDFSDINPEFARKKLFYRMHLEYIPTGDYNLPITYTIDDKEYGPVNFNMDNNGEVAIADSGVFRRQRALAGEGYYFACRITEDTINSPKLGRIWIEFKPTSMNR